MTDSLSADTATRLLERAVKEINSLRLELERERAARRIVDEALRRALAEIKAMKEK